MPDNTIKPSNGQSLNLHEDTQIYLCARPSVRVFEIDIFDNIGSILNFRASGLRIAREIIRRQGGENITIELTHEKFAEALWPDLEPGARVRKFTRGLKNYREDTEATGFCFMNPRKQKPKLTEDGFRGVPTKYEPGDYWRLSGAIQERAKEIDFFAFPVDRRRRKERDELKAILKEMGCRRRVSEKKAEETKPAKPSLPCNCACANCAKCAAKAPAPAPSDEPVLSVQIQNAKDKGIEIERDMVSLGTSLLNFGNKVSVVDNKLNAICMAARVQLKTAVARKEGRGAEYAPNTEARAHGRAGLELAIEGLKDAQRAAEEMGKHQHAKKLGDFARVLSEWEVFRNREVAE